MFLSPLPSNKTGIASNSVTTLNYYRNESLLKVFSYQTNSKHDLLDYALDEAIKLTNSTIGYIYFYDEALKKFTLNSWSKGVVSMCDVMEKQIVYKLEETGFWGEVVRQKKAVINNDFGAHHPLKKGVPKGHAPLKRFLSLPIFDDGKIVAVIGLGNKQDEYTETDIHQINLFLEAVWNVFKRRQAEIDFFKEREQLKTTIESIDDGIITLDLNLKILNINTVAMKLMKFTHKMIFNTPLLELLGPEYEGVMTYINKCIASSSTEFEGYAKHNYDRQEPLVIKLEKNSNTTILSLRFSVIQTKQHAIQGYVLTIHDISKEFMDSQRIAYMSYHDALTGLYNRRYFEEEVQRINTKRQRPLTIIMGDVNGLKLSNDAFGHLVGDKLLKEVANILVASCREEDVVARWGGDEFVILLPRTSESRAKEIVEEIKKACKENTNLVVDVSISLGYATKLRDESIEQLIQKAEDRLYQNKLSEGKSQRSAIIETIKTSLQERSHETEEHAQRLKQYSLQIADKLNLSDEEKNSLGLLALLHDIGKIGIPDYILLKKDTLSEQEWVEMKKHTVIGYRIAQSSSDLQQIAPLILHHHEWYDGTGYPDRIKGDHIPLLSRIISVVDAFDAMTTDRPYRNALTKQNAINILRENSGTQFDPLITKIFVDEILFTENVKL